MMGDILVSPVWKKVFCGKPNFAFTPKSMIVAKLDRAELGDFDALVLGLLLMSHFKRQIVVPDGGFYLRDAHLSLMRERRLIVGVNSLSELSPKLQQGVLLFEGKIGSGCTWEDACTLARYAGLTPQTIAHGDFVTTVMS
jgi:hypothetical protein